MTNDLVFETPCGLLTEKTRFGTHSACAVISASSLTADGVLVPRSTQIKTYSWDNAQVLLVGNKCDMEDERVVGGDRGRQLSEHLGE